MKTSKQAAKTQNCCFYFFYLHHFQREVIPQAPFPSIALRIPTAHNFTRD